MGAERGAGGTQGWIKPGSHQANVPGTRKEEAHAARAKLRRRLLSVFIPMSHGRGDWVVVCALTISLCEREQLERPEKSLTAYAVKSMKAEIRTAR